MNPPLHEMQQSLDWKGQATSLWSSSHYDSRMDTGMLQRHPKNQTDRARQQLDP